MICIEGKGGLKDIHKNAHCTKCSAIYRFIIQHLLSYLFVINLLLKEDFIGGNRRIKKEYTYCTTGEMFVFRILPDFQIKYLNAIVFYF